MKKESHPQAVLIPNEYWENKGLFNLNLSKLQVALMQQTETELKATFASKGFKDNKDNRIAHLICLIYSAQQFKAEVLADFAKTLGVETSYAETLIQKRVIKTTAANESDESDEEYEDDLPTSDESAEKQHLLQQQRLMQQQRLLDATTAPATAPDATTATAPATAPDATTATAPATAPDATTATAPATAPDATTATAPATAPDATTATAPATAPDATTATAPATAPDATTAPATAPDATTAPATAPDAATAPATAPDATTATAPATASDATTATAPATAALPADSAAAAIIDAADKLTATAAPATAPATAATSDKTPPVADVTAVVKLTLDEMKNFKGSKAFEEVLSKAQFGFYLEKVVTKAAEYKARGEDAGNLAAFGAATSLYRDLVAARYKLYSATGDDLNQHLTVFKNECQTAINKAGATLQTHRGEFAEFLRKFLSVVLSIGTLGLANLVTGSSMTGLFAVRTDGKVVVDAFNAQIDAIVTTPAAPGGSAA